MSASPTVLLLTATLLCSGCAGFHPAESTDVGAGARHAGIDAIDVLLQAEVDSGHVAGAAVLVTQGDRTLHRGAYGYAQRYAFGGEAVHPRDPLTADHLFDLASLTKVFATTFGIMMLVDRGAVDLDVPVSTYLPEFSGGAKDSITIRHLLTHSSGLTPWDAIYYHASTRDDAFDYIAEAPLRYEVGAGRHYSDLGFMLLGYLIEEIGGTTLDVFLQENLYEPLGLDDTMFRPLANGVPAERIAATSHGNPFERRMVYDDEFGYAVDVDPESWDGWRQYTLRGEVNDGNAYYAHEGVAGHAGLFSTLDDLHLLLDLLIKNGRAGEEQIIDPAVVRTFLDEDAFGNALGWARSPGFIQARGAPAGTFGHTGFTGTNVVVVPDDDLAIILLTNRQNVGLQPDGTYYDLNPTRQRLTTIVLETVED